MGNSDFGFMGSRGPSRDAFASQSRCASPRSRSQSARLVVVRFVIGPWVDDRRRARVLEHAGLSLFGPGAPRPRGVEQHARRDQTWSSLPV